MDCPENPRNQIKKGVAQLRQSRPVCFSFLLLWLILQIGFVLHMLPEVGFQDLASKGKRLGGSPSNEPLKGSLTARAGGEVSQ